jgi:hypothetical protein
VKRLLPLLFLAACSHKDAPPPDPHHECVDACTTMVIRLADEANKKPHALEDGIDPAAAPEACEDFCKEMPGLDTGCMYTAKSMDDAKRCMKKTKVLPLSP